MEVQLLDQVLTAAERHFSAFISEARDLLGKEGALAPDDRRNRFIWQPGEFDLIPAEKIHEYLAQSLESMAEWQVVETTDGESQRWPDGNVDTYGEFVVYRGEGPFAGVKLALGVANTPGKDHEAVGFVMGATGQSKRPLTVFFPAADHDTTGELLSMIRGKNGGRSGFAPSDQLPTEYAGFATGVLGERIPGKWNVRAVIVKNDEAGRQAMLNHTAIQARLRGLI